MKLVVRDVAALLDVSDKTIYRWITQRKLPAHRINDQYRFNRTEILEWATANQIPLTVEILKEDQAGLLPGLGDALRVGGIFYRVFGRDKTAVLSEVVQVMPLPEEVDRTFLLEVLLARESMGSTGIGGGIAVPHVRNPIVMHIPRPMVSLCFLEHPVPFQAIDGAPVHTLFTIVSPTIRGHLHLLSRLSYALQQDDFKKAIARQALREEMLREVDKIDARLDAPATGRARHTP